ncbi:MAG: saccharopine dehydrogenase NADP-binding domain-containing protein [Magnetospirillum sp.]|nr:saccharopine dehydrogenase NADP-binding domain-containing protein [Magnetospirillum sp.]
MARVLVLGAGKIGATVAAMLAGAGDDQVVLGDVDRAILEARAPAGMATLVVDADDPFALRSALAGQDVVVAALPFFLDVRVAEAARAERVHYFDLTEDVATRRRIERLAEGAGSVFIPQCGLAPGFVAIAAMALVDRFDEVLDVRLRVGALPKFPDNALKYNLTWSTDGLINEYCNACEAIVDGRPMEVLPLEGVEEFSLDGVVYEAFSTSGGVGTLCETLAGRVRNLDYKTVRYPGHRAAARMLAHDLKLCRRRDLFRDVIEHAVPVTSQDVVLVFVTVVGRRKGLLTQETWTRKVYGDGSEDGLSAIQKTTAAGLCAMIDLHRQGRLPEAGFVRQEQARLDDMLDNRFGRVFG